MPLTETIFSVENLIYAIAYGMIMSLLTSFFICWGYRHQAGMSIVTPVHSVCDNCEEPINVVYTIPVIGTLLCKGACRKCNFIYPKTSFIFELASVIIFPVLFLLGLGLFTIVTLSIFWCVLMFTVSSSFN